MFYKIPVFFMLCYIPQGDKVFQKDSVTVQVGNVLDIEATLPPDTSYAWVVPKQTGMEFRNSGLTGFVFPKATGVYSIGLAYGKSIKIAWITVNVTDGGVVPPPSPPPPVDPPPPPPGVNSPVWIVVVSTPKTIPPELTKMFQYAPLVDEILAKNHGWKIIDSDGKDDKGNRVIEVQGAVAAAKGKTLPWVFVVEQNPNQFNIIASSPLPSTPAEMLKLITKK